MAKPRRTFSDQIKQAISDCGKSRYQIAQESGITEATLSRFFNGKTGIATHNLDALAECLGLRIVVDKPRNKRGES